MKKVYVLQVETEQDCVIYTNIVGIYATFEQAVFDCEAKEADAFECQSYFVIEWEVQ